MPTIRVVPPTLAQEAERLAERAAALAGAGPVLARALQELADAGPREARASAVMAAARWRSAVDLLADHGRDVAVPVRDAGRTYTETDAAAADSVGAR